MHSLYCFCLLLSLFHHGCGYAWLQTSFGHGCWSYYSIAAADAARIGYPLLEHDVRNDHSCMLRMRRMKHFIWKIQPGPSPCLDCSSGAAFPHCWSCQRYFHSTWIHHCDLELLLLLAPNYHHSMVHHHHSQPSFCHNTDVHTNHLKWIKSRQTLPSQVRNSY